MIWESVPLSQVVRVRRGHDLPARVRKPGSVPVVSSGGMSGYHDTAIANGPGVVLGRATNLGQPTWVDGPYWPHNTTLYVEDFCGNDPRWVFWWFKTNDLSGYNSGSVQPMLNRNYIAKVPVSLPPLEEQERIAGVLGAFDDLIETNRRLVRNMDLLGKSIVVSVQSHSREAFKTVRLSEACDVIESGRRPKGGVKGIASGVPSLGAESVNGLTEFQFSKTKYVPSEFAAQMKRGVLEDFDVLVYKDGGKPGEFFPDVSIVGSGYPFDDMVINEHVFRVRAAAPLGQGYLYFWLSTDRIMDRMKEIGSRTAAIPGMNSTNFAQLPIVVPDEPWRSAHIDTLDRLVASALLLLAENRDLARQRDELLPLLMSGRVRVRDVEASVS